MINWMRKKGADLWTGLFLMIFSGAVIHEALDLEVGTPANPGSGFMIFGAAVVLGVLALLQFIKTLLGRTQTEEASDKVHLWRIIAVVGANVLYIVLLEPVG